MSDISMTQEADGRELINILHTLTLSSSKVEVVLGKRTT